LNLSRPFIRRPVATTLLTVGLALAGVLAFFKLPVSPLPKVDFPTIVVQAQVPGASPDTMAASVAAPLERHLGVIADVSEMTSQSTVGSTRIVLGRGHAMVSRPRHHARLPNPGRVRHRRACNARGHISMPR
jgi:multidrug efflux pump